MNREKPSKDTGIVCDVKNCVYHDGEHTCRAENISIGPTYATDCTETVCATFKAKEL